MQARRYLWFILFAVALAACAGGSGSSGFDVTSENVAIRQALDGQHCVTHKALMICPADEMPRLPTPSATATSAPGRTLSPTPLATATPTGTTSAGPTATPTPTVAPRVDTGVSPSGGIACAVSNGSQMCSLQVPFLPQGFPSGAVFRVAARTDPNSPWTISSAPILAGPVDMPSFDAAVALKGVTGVPSAGVSVQIAILVFDHAPATIPMEVAELADSGATFAFVTSGLTVQPAVATSPSP